MPKGNRNLGKVLQKNYFFTVGDVLIMKKNNVSFNTIKARLSDGEINYQKISNITFAVATEKDVNNNQVGNGRDAGNRFESILRYALQDACHDVNDPDNKSKADLSFGGVDCADDFQVKRYQPGFAQISTMAGNKYFTELKNIYMKSRRTSGKQMNEYFSSFELPPDFLQVQNNKTGETNYYLFEVGEIARNARKLEYVSNKTCDKIRMLDKHNDVILEVRSGEDPQANCLTRGAWVNTDWLSKNVDPIESNVASTGININEMLWNYGADI